MNKLSAVTASAITQMSHGIVGLRRRTKRVILCSIDFVALSITLWALVSLRYWQPFLPENPKTLALFLAAPIITAALLLLYRVYNEVTRFIGFAGSMKLVYVIGLATLIWAVLVLMVGQAGIPRSVMIVYGLAAPIVAISVRSAAAAALRWSGIVVPSRGHHRSRMPVAIYGAGRLGIQLSQSLARNATREVVAFIDSNPGLTGRRIDGLRVFPPDRTNEIINSKNIEEVIIAISDMPAAERVALLKQLEQNKVRVRVLPELEAFTSGRVKMTDLRGIDGSDLLGRDPVPPISALIERSVSGKRVMVTGGGGSIGSEIVRQVVQFTPQLVVIVDHSEAALFNIEQEVSASLMAMGQERRPEILTRLVSVGDRMAMEEIFARQPIDTVFHAAAYKHVPMIEQNPIAGVVNNIFATQLLADLAVKYSVKRFVFVSTDKAVRPTSVMGATKRVAELVLQDRAGDETGTVFCCVRFGNVLGSSGSVVRRFVDQIRVGGPVTLTSQDMVRYFMSVDEAASLVIQSGGMAKGGETFLLDMGEPVKIQNLARSMIRLMGYRERTEDEPDGEIEIVYTGLRPGEKLVEELLVDPGNSAATEHPRIMNSLEPSVSSDDLSIELANLQRSVSQRDNAFVVASLKKLVAGYQVSPTLLMNLSMSSEKKIS